MANQISTRLPNTISSFWEPLLVKEKSGRFHICIIYISDWLRNFNLSLTRPAMGARYTLRLVKPSRYVLVVHISFSSVANHPVLSMIESCPRIGYFQC